MASDNIQPIIGANEIKNGSLVVWHSETGDTAKRDPDLNSYTPSGDLNTLLYDRFDDPRYYSGDDPL